MKKGIYLPLLMFYFTLTFSFAQNINQAPIPTDQIEVANAAAGSLCPGEPCPCEGGYREIEFYYFGEDNVNINVYSNNDLTNLITSFPAVSSGDLLPVSGAGLPSGYLTSFTHFEVTNALGEVCVTKIYTQCPKNVWPGSLDDLQIIGKTFGDFTVFSVTDDETSYVCDISNAEQDWRVGGNVVSPANNTFGTLNNESVTIITNNDTRGIITASGDFGIGTTTPNARLEVDGDVEITETLDVYGITTIHNTTSSTAPNDGALVVAGGTGIAENLNVGGNATIRQNLTVEAAGLTRLLNTTESISSGTGSLVVSGGVGIGKNTNIGQNLTVEAAGLTRLLNTAESTSSGTGSLVVGGGVGIGKNTNIGQNLTVEAAGLTRLLNTAESTSSGTGSLVVGGGVGIGKNTNIGQNLTVEAAGLTRLLNTAESTSSGTGSLVVGGGVGIAKNTYIGQTLDVAINGYFGGEVGIGTNIIPTNYKLAVDGRIICEEVRVQLSENWPDYVFHSDYELPTLRELEQSIKENGHLPGIPSAQEMENSEGIAVGKMQQLMLKKIEELTLYAIEADKQNQQLRETLQKTQEQVLKLLNIVASKKNNK